MLLLPLAENAVKHGPAAGHRGALTLAVAPEGGGVDLRIRNPGPCGPPRDGGQGLDTVRRRLRLAYGDAAALLLLEIEVDGQPWTEARLRLPAAGPATEVPT